MRHKETTMRKAANGPRKPKQPSWVNPVMQQAFEQARRKQQQGSK